MPVYCYRCVDCDAITEEYRQVDDRDDLALCECGQPAERDRMAEQVHTDSGYRQPILSDAAGVHPSQVAEARREAVEHNIPVDYTPDGRAIFTSHSQRQKALRKLGLVDRDGFH